MSQDDDDQDNNLLVVPGIINAPRTPGDMSQVRHKSQYFQLIDFHFKNLYLHAIKKCRAERQKSKMFNRARRR